MPKQNVSRKESGNAVLAVLVILVIAAVGGLVFLSTQMGDKKEKGGENSSQIASAEAANAAATQTAAGQQDKAPIKPGDPVVATVNGQEIKRTDVFNFIVQQISPNLREQQPVEQLFPLAQDQVITARVIEEKTKNVNLDNDPEVKKQLAAAKEQIVRAAYINSEITKRITEDRVKAAYDQYVKQFPDIDEVKVRHIVVENESSAKDVIAKLDQGGSFEEIAKEKSIDTATSANGGEIGYITKNDKLIPEFIEAAFGLEPGSYTKNPVKTQFGFHIIKAEDKRKKQPEKYETAKPYIQEDLRRVVLNEIVEGWRKEARVERFDINGDAIEPSAGDDSAEAAQ